MKVWEIHYWLNTTNPPSPLAYELRNCARRIPLHKLNQEMTGRAGATTTINCCSTPSSSSLVTGGSKEVVAVAVKLASCTKPRSRRLRRCQRRDWMPTECVAFKPASHSYDVAYPLLGTLQPGTDNSCELNWKFSKENANPMTCPPQVGTCVDPWIQ